MTAGSVCAALSQARGVVCADAGDRSPASAEEWELVAMDSFR